MMSMAENERRDRSFPGPVLDGSFGSKMDGEGARRTLLGEFPIPAFAWAYRAQRLCTEASCMADRG